MPVTVRTVTWCTIWRIHHVTQQVSSSAGRSKIKDFPSLFFLETTATVVEHHDGHRTPKLTWHSIVSLMNKRISLLFVFNNFPIFSGTDGEKTAPSTTSVASMHHPHISPGHSPSLPGLLSRSVALKIPQGGDMSAVTELTFPAYAAALCAGHCSARPAACMLKWRAFLTALSAGSFGCWIRLCRSSPIFYLF